MGLRAFRYDDEGSATVEFVLIAPFLLAIVLSVFESGWLMTKYMMLDRGLDMAIRDVRLMTTPNMTHDQLKTKICDYSLLFRDCETTLIVELVPVDFTTPYPANQPRCYDRTGIIAPVIDYTAAGYEQIMFVRACVITDPMFPGIGLGLQLQKDASGGFQMISYSAFMSEPN
ncbi:MAG: TadE/TadG family type IV pilus assembly protein [Paracoccaceae bacterium]